MFTAKVSFIHESLTKLQCKLVNCDAHLVNHRVISAFYTFQVSLPVEPALSLDLVLTAHRIRLTITVCPVKTVSSAKHSISLASSRIFLKGILVS